MFAVRLLADFDRAAYPNYARYHKRVLLYSAFLHERHQAERLASLWSRQTSKPPLDHLDEIYPDDYPKVPEAIHNLEIEIIDTEVDECSYNGDDPRYAGEYGAIADALVARLELNDPSGLWSR